MRCRTARSLFEDDMGDALAPIRRKQLDEHLSRCEDCRSVLEVLGRLDERLRSASFDKEPPERLKARILASTAAATAPAATAVRGWRLVRIAAATAAATTLLFVAATRLAEWHRAPEPSVRVRLALPGGTVLARTPEITVVKAGRP